MSEAQELRIVFCTLPDIDQARQIGTLLVERQLAACVNLVPGVESIFRWDGKVDQSHEVLAIIKTTVARYPQLEQTLQELHPYDVPEIVAVPVTSALDAYAKWVRGWQVPE